MSIYVGSAKQYNIFLAGVEIPEVYVGAAKIYPEAPPAVTTHPVSVTATDGDNFTMTAAATGSTPLGMQWFEIIPGGSWAAISGQTTTTLTHQATLARDQASYMCRFTDLYGQYTDTNSAILTAVPAAFSATGGTITDVGGFRYHTFTASGDFEVVSGVGDVEFLLVGGGGGAGSGGGGAGGHLPGAQAGMTVGVFPAVVGAGGAGGDNPGGASTFNGLSGDGGGAGGFGVGGNGGSGGGGQSNDGTAGGTGVAGQGFAGGVGASNTGNNYGGAGGGASAIGGNGRKSSPYGGGHGGDGLAWLDGVVRAGGGGGYGSYSAATPGEPGAGGGGTGGNNSNGTDGVPNTGGGGGGSSSTGKAGGSGIVIVRYAFTP